MSLEFEKLKESELFIKKIAKDITLITTKNQDHSSEQVITFVEYPNGQKYISIAPRKIKSSFKYNHASFLFLIRDLEKGISPYSEKSKVELIVYSPKEKKFTWESSFGNKKVEEIVLKNLTKRKEALKRFRSIKRV